MSRSLLFILMDNHLERGPYMFRVAQASPPAGFGTVPVQGSNVFPWSGSGTLAELAAGTAALRTLNTYQPRGLATPWQAGGIAPPLNGRGRLKAGRQPCGQFPLRW